MVTFVLIMKPIASLGHDVIFSTQGYTALEALLQQKEYSKSFILVDSTTHQHCIHHFLSQLQQSYDFEIIEIDPAKNTKTSRPVLVYGKPYLNWVRTATALLLTLAEVWSLI